MAKYKNFGALKEGDYIFSVEIKESYAKQNAIGHIYNRFIVQKVTGTSITAMYDKSPFLPSWNPSMGDSYSTVISIDPSKQVKRIYPKTGATTMDGKVNCTIFSTNIETLIEEVEDIIDTLNEEVIELKNKAKTLEGILNNFALNFHTRKHMDKEFESANLIPDYQEVIVTEEVYV